MRKWKQNESNFEVNWFVRSDFLSDDESPKRKINTKIASTSLEDTSFRLSFCSPSFTWLFLVLLVRACAVNMFWLLSSKFGRQAASQWNHIGMNNHGLESYVDKFTDTIDFSPIDSHLSMWVYVNRPERQIYFFKHIFQFPSYSIYEMTKKKETEEKTNRTSATECGQTANTEYGNWFFCECTLAKYFINSNKIYCVSILCVIIVRRANELS